MLKLWVYISSLVCMWSWHIFRFSLYLESTMMKTLPLLPSPLGHQPPPPPLHPGRESRKPLFRFIHNLYLPFTPIKCLTGFGTAGKVKQNIFTPRGGCRGGGEFMFSKKYAYLRIKAGIMWFELNISFFWDSINKHKCTSSEGYWQSCVLFNSISCFINLVLHCAIELKWGLIIDLSLFIKSFRGIIELNNWIK